MFLPKAQLKSARVFKMLQFRYAGKNMLAVLIYASQTNYAPLET